VRDLQAACGLHLSVTAMESDGDITLRLHSDRADLGAEGYELLIAPDGVGMVAATAHGLWNATRTFVQMLSPEAAEQTLPGIHIIDGPRFEWRGAMLDVARHFFGVDHVVRFIELIARYKLNRLHLHLTDDQGWRIEIPGWPRLTSVGGAGAVDGDVGGFFTHADWSEILGHAARHFVTIVPEVDMPGHTHAALSSVPALNPDGIAPAPYIGRDVGFSSLQLQLPETARFVADVIATLAAITPGPYLHLGGDEAHSTDRDEYLGFIELLQQEVSRHGKRMVGWEEIAVAPLHAATLVQHWLRPEALLALPATTRCIMSPAARTYLDMRHADGDTIGRRWAGDIDLDTAYDWDPAGLVPGIDDDRIAGVEAPLWTEKVRNFREVEQLCFPRLACLAEVGWTPQAARGWASVRPRLIAEAARLTANGVSVHRSRVLET
jgi:hexosaminidase